MVGVVRSAAHVFLLGITLKMVSLDCEYTHEGSHWSLITEWAIFPPFG